MQDKTRTRVGLIGASFETGNMGVGALAAGSIRCIRRQFPGAEIFILDYAYHPSSHRVTVDREALDVPLVNMRFSKSVWLANNIALLLALAILVRLAPSRGIRRRLLSSNSTLRELWRTEVFTAIAGGDSFSDIYGLRRLLYVALPQILVIVLGKRLVLLPQTFGPCRSHLSRYICRFITSYAASIYARDQKSIETVRALLGKKPRKTSPTFRYDVGFALEPTAPHKVDIEGDIVMGRDLVIGLNVSGLLYMGGYDEGNMFGLRVDYKELLLKVLEFFIDKKDVRVLLVPHVFGDRRVAESDVTACESVYNAWGPGFGPRLGILRGDYDQGEIKYVIGRCDFFLGSRMHACIAAVSQCVPTVAIAYSDKFIGVMETIGIPSIVADARELALDEFLRQIEGLYETRAQRRAELEMRMPSVLESTLDLFRNSFSSQPQNKTPVTSPGAYARST